jgi:hypothetical protein
MVNESVPLGVTYPVTVSSARRMAMRYLLVAASLVLGSVRSADAQVSVGVGITFPGVQIGVNVPTYPELVLVPGYPVYYDPRAETNYFFYDGVYWVYQGDNWYASSWYNGPWRIVRPEAVPLYVLRVPVRYYRAPPPYFRGWRDDAPPRWGDHWGRGWARAHPAWDRWDRRAVPRPAPLPAYQREYVGDRYPRPEEQHFIRGDHYRYRPREAAAREHFQDRGEHRGERRDDRRGDPQRGPPPPRDDRRMQRREPPGPPGDLHRREPPGQRPDPHGRGQGREGHDDRRDDDRGQGRR